MPLLPAEQFVSHPQHLSQFPAVKSQWQNPGDILSILMLVGGDIVQRAVAQLTGSGPFFVTPVAFSFGWVAYSINAVLSSVGTGRLMPDTDCPSILINAKNGYTRQNQSWALGRLLRDHQSNYDHLQRGLTASLYRTSPSKQTGRPTPDWVYYCSVAVIPLQISISIIPGVLYDDWAILSITVAGIALALATGALPQWRTEKWAARPLVSRDGQRKREVISLTRGNGSKDVIVIVSDSTGLRLEDLAAGRDVHSSFTVTITCILAILWIAHLLTMAGLRNHAWYSLAIGALGMVQNVIAAGARRSQGALGFHLERTSVIHGDKVLIRLPLWRA
ncbi:hypothetical protein B0F90DRAFT_1665105 [Multifurca ochricompacta]|uniref:Uncharacterized protein n=1 Tax=Multifurca ochricompacta TaxID=376703 RepID=A0AAD4MDY6_9AGAM|nr:hypothetical protein B0F90DRAFT_1665105 [Multifurca ochricompacta]